MDFSLNDFPSRKNLEKYSLDFPGLDVDAAMAFLKFLKVSREFFAATERRLGEYGISMGKFMVLMLLFSYKEGPGLTPSELAGRSGVTKATITGLIDGLQKSVFVTKSGGGADRRKFYVSLTESGNSFLRSILPKHFEFISGVMGEFDRAGKSMLSKCVDKISSGVEKVSR